MKNKVFLTLMLVVALSTVACGRTVENTVSSDVENAIASWQEQYDLGMRYLEEGDYEQAIVAFTAVIGIDPKQVDAYINLANIYIEQEDYENAVSILQKGLESCDETETLNEKLSEVNQLIAEKESEAAKEEAARLENEKLQELETSYGMIDTEDASPVDQGISNYVFCDADGDGVNELLIVSRDENAVIYAEMYALSGEELIPCFKEELTEMIYSHKADFVSVKVGRPLLSSHEDFENVCRALMDDYRDLAGDEAAVFIGHGSDHHGNVVYCALDYIMKDLGYGNAHIGTFKAYPQIDTVIRHLEKSGIHHVHVAPFMFVAGVSAMEGVCGDAVNSMKKQLESAGFTVTAHRKCLGEYDGIRKIYLDHLNACMAD